MTKVIKSPPNSDKGNNIATPFVPTKALQPLEIAIVFVAIVTSILGIVTNDAYFISGFYTFSTIVVAVLICINNAQKQNPLNWTVVFTAIIPPLYFVVKDLSEKKKVTIFTILFVLIWGGLFLQARHVSQEDPRVKYVGRVCSMVSETDYYVKRDIQCMYTLDLSYQANDWYKGMVVTTNNRIVSFNVKIDSNPERLELRITNPEGVQKID